LLGVLERWKRLLPDFRDPAKVFFRRLIIKRQKLKRIWSFIGAGKLQGVDEGLELIDVVVLGWALGEGDFLGELGEFKVAITAAQENVWVLSVVDRLQLTGAGFSDEISGESWREKLTKIHIKLPSTQNHDKFHLVLPTNPL
jgi:hypothetical protein